ncbi:MAG: hypothetical protein E6J76_13075 [Deltaproteobacteria bacterium]|nr:MAG: hypothetical protein E6J76_13075 [Deltaproteobacteria bacterium]
MGARQRLRRALALIALFGAAVCGAERAHSATSFIPIPEIITDPNEGNTLGFLGVFLFLDDKDEIRYMLAPDIRYNKTKGVFPSLRLFAYPSPTRRYSIEVGKSTTRDEDYELEFTDRGYWDGRAFVIASFVRERDSTERFFGIGNQTQQDEESNYTETNTIAQVTPGVWLLPRTNLSYRMLIRRTSVQNGQVTSIPSIFKLHRETPGLEPGFYWTHRVALTYDSRDEIDIPSHGALALGYVEAADRQLGSSTSFVSDTPFWEQSQLGGRRTLRGFGAQRFVDFNRSLGSAELRTRVWQHRLFGVKAELEVAPFTEAGQVFRHVLDSPVSDLHFVYGVGFRGVVRPQIVGFVDVGRSSEGTAIFTGINYPF